MGVALTWRFYDEHCGRLGNTNDLGICALVKCLNLFFNARVMPLQ